tara:strand:- start:2525 stop:3403 length:879 start_codon:yes stop_codon:yes gene_type:complete
MNEFIEKLANTRSSSTSSDHLRLLAKRAASIFSEDQDSGLNNAISSAIGGEDLNRDQISRVTEMANQETWKHLFAEGNGDRNASFSPGESSSIIDSLATTPDQAAAPITDYAEDPRGESIPDDLDLENLFGVSKDTPEYESLNPSRSEEVAHDKAAAAADLARHGIDGLIRELQDINESFYEQVKQAHIRDGHSILQIAKSVAEVTEPAFAENVIQVAATKMQENGIKIDLEKEASIASAPFVVNTEHPLLETAVVFEKIASSYVKAARTQEKLEAHAADTAKALKDKIRGV